MDIKEQIKDLDLDKQEEVIEFLCYMLADNVDMCPGALYDYDKKDDKLCLECPGHDIDEETTKICWLNLAIHDTGGNK